MTIGPVPSQPTNNNTTNDNLRPPFFCHQCGYEGKAVLGIFMHCHCCEDHTDEKDYQEGQ